MLIGAGDMPGASEVGCPTARPTVLVRRPGRRGEDSNDFVRQNWARAQYRGVNVPILTRPAGRAGQDQLRTSSAAAQQRQQPAAQMVAIIREGPRLPRIPEPASWPHRETLATQRLGPLAVAMGLMFQVLIRRIGTASVVSGD